MKVNCLNCNKVFETHTKTKYCCEECKKHHKNILLYPDGSEYVECQICHHRAIDLNKHIKKHHNLTSAKYCSKFNIEMVDLQTKSMREHNIEMQKKAYAEGRAGGWGHGDANPSRRVEVKEGRKSIFSMNYEGYDGLTDEQKKEKIQDLLHNLAEAKKKKHNNPLTLDYYETRGFTKEEAKKMLAERQSAFSLEKCIEKYGENEGRKKFEERQKKWQDTLNSKPQEEKDRINSLKASVSKYICSYSKISQKLFCEIYDIIKNDFNEIYFATKKSNNCENSNANFEYEVILDDKIHRFFLDFYVKDNNKVIEFDGDYWHSEAKGNQLRDKARENTLKKLGFTKILHVKEHDYRCNPKEVVEKCVKFLKEQ